MVLRTLLILKHLKDSEEFKSSLKNYTGKYLEKGIFGVPTFFISEKMFFDKTGLILLLKS